MNPHYKQSALEEFDELLSHYKDSDVSTNYAVNVLRRKPNSILEAEIKSFLSSHLDLAYEAGRNDTLDEVGKAAKANTPNDKSFELNPYLKIVEDGNFDDMFDYGWKQAVNSILSLINEARNKK